MTAHELLRVGGDRLRISAWRSHQGVAVVLALPEDPPPSVLGLRRCVDVLATRGVTQVLTGALSRPEQQPFLAAGFEVHESLHLLAHDLRNLPDVARGAPLRRGRDRDRPAALAVDRLAFDPFWRLDAAGLDDAMHATPAHRFRLAAAPEREARDEIVGYAVSGRAGPRGYLQRLAVSPTWQGRGIGAALVTDGLRWMRRRGVEQAVVNTQFENRSALELYRRLGFVDQPDGLAVLTCSVGSPAA